jgi:hypothetical protein
MKFARQDLHKLLAKTDTRLTSPAAGPLTTRYVRKLRARPLRPGEEARGLGA